MITCYVRYVIDPKKTKEFETYAKMWIPLVAKFALALFTFESLAAYEEYRIKSLSDAECIKAFEFADEVDCIVSYERSFFRPVFD